MRFFGLALLCLFWLAPAWAESQPNTYFCKFDESQSSVVCVRAGGTVPVFQYSMPDLVNDEFSKWLSSNDPATTPATSAQCLSQAEQFRELQLEKGINNSLKGLRQKAESLRQTSEDVDLYGQIIFVYRALFGEYNKGIRSYRDAVTSCQVTPYAVRPDHT